MAEQNTQALKLLDEVVARLDEAIAAKTGEPAGTGGPVDAIDRELAAPPLRTAAARIRGSDAMEQFRRELETQSLTVTTATAFLQVLQRVLPLLLARG